VRPVIWAEKVLVGAALAGLTVGLTLIMLTAPIVTGTLVRATGGAELTGLPEPLALSLAEDVRLYVTRRDAPELAATVGGREGFSARAVAHLDDVRDVISGARVATGILAGAIAVWVALGIARGRIDALETGLTAGAYATVGLVGLALLGALAGFDRFFAGFHGLFFDGGTWQFGAGELLIQLFPEGFWMTAGLLWGVLCVLGALVLYAVAQAIARRTPPKPGS
jgi:integral membrane protein (TIGR01906 family)